MSGEILYRDEWKRPNGPEEDILRYNPDANQWGSILKSFTFPVSVPAMIDVRAQAHIRHKGVDIGWIATGLTPTYVSTTQFTVSGDQRGTFPVGRRIKTGNSGPGWVHSGVISCLYDGTITKVTVSNDIGALDAGLNSVSINHGDGYALFACGVICLNSAATEAGLPPEGTLGTILQYHGENILGRTDKYFCAKLDPDEPILVPVGWHRIDFRVGFGTDASQMAGLADIFDVNGQLCQARVRVTKL